MSRVFRNTIFYLVIFLILIAIVSMFNSPASETEQMNYNQFTEVLEEGQVNEMTLQYTNFAYEVRGEYTGDEGTQSFIAEIPANDEIIKAIVTQANQQSELTVEPAEEPSAWARVLTTLIPFIIIFILSSSCLAKCKAAAVR